MLDMKGPEIRTDISANNAIKIKLIKDQTIVLTSDYTLLRYNTKPACSYPALTTSVAPRKNILVADGSVVLKALTCIPLAGEVMCRIMNNATIGERKNMNLPGVVVDLPILTAKDADVIKTRLLSTMLTSSQFLLCARQAISKRSMRS
jgi:pyruvate kinase